MFTDREYFSIFSAFGSVSLIFILYLSFSTPFFKKIENKEQQNQEREGRK